MKRACTNIQRMTKANFLSILPSYYDTTFVIDTLTNEKVRIDSLNNGPIVKIQVLDPGSGFTSTPDIVLSGDGTGATASAVIVDSKINRIDITNAGQGYTKSPSVTISGGGGTGAYAIAYLRDLTNIFTNGLYKGRYKRIEQSYPKSIFVSNDNWEIKSFNPATRQVCIYFDGNVDKVVSYTIPLI